MRTACRDLIRLLLALAFVGGNFGLPVADALVFHSVPGSPAPQKPSLGGPGGETGHQQLCLQLKATGQARSLPASGAGQVDPPQDLGQRVLTVVAAPPSSHHPASHHSRAPPLEAVRG
jgi:hypothetical protein